MQYVTVGDVVRINQHFTRATQPDFGRLDSAVARPMTTVNGIDAYPSVHEKAGALMHSLVQNHPFVDGNKRTGFTAAYILLRLNGWRLTLDQDQAVGLAVDVANGRLNAEDVAKALADASERVELQEEEER
jgi:death-on-curing protein